MGISRPPVGQSVVIIKVIRQKRVVIVHPPSPLQFGARDLGFSFLGSGGGAGECGLFDQRSQQMSGDMSDEEEVFEITKDGRFDDETVEPEVIIRLPRDYDLAPELVPRATPMDPGAVSAEADTPDLRQHRRVGPMNGAKPKQPMFETPTLLIPGHDRPLPRAGTQPVTSRFMDEPLTLPTTEHGRPPLRAGTQPVTDQFMNELPTLPTPGHGRPPPRAGTQPVTDQFMHELPTLPTAASDRNYGNGNLATVCFQERRRGHCDCTRFRLVGTGGEQVPEVG